VATCPRALTMDPSANLTEREEGVSVRSQRWAKVGSMKSVEAPLSTSAVASWRPKKTRSLKRRAGWLRAPWSSSGGSGVSAESDRC